MVIQSAGTGLTFDSGNFLVVLAAPAAGDAVVAGVEVAVFVAGFWAHPPVSSAAALKSSNILFIDPPEVIVFWKSVPTRGKSGCRAFEGKIHSIIEE
jgi:hypothetical protein